MWDPEIYAQAAVDNAADGVKDSAVMYSTLALAAAIEKLATAMTTRD
jgi:hypothetical protein